jgi:hypothetical protein
MKRVQERLLQAAMYANSAFDIISEVEDQVHFD